MAFFKPGTSPEEREAILEATMRDIDELRPKAEAMMRGLGDLLATVERIRPKDKG